MVCLQSDQVTPLTCIVYDLSLLASIPNSLLSLIPSEDLPSARPRALFNVGIHDIPYLSSFINKTATSDEDSSWIACTTDSVLSMKHELYDVLVTLPPHHSKNAAEKAHPKISVMAPASGKRNQPQSFELKATQRDARRYSLLCKILRQLSPDERAEDAAETDDSDAASTYSSSSVVEPFSWTRLAYTSFIWWASAGESRDGLSEEEEEQQIEQDTRLLASVESLPVHLSGSSSRRRSMQADGSASGLGPQQQPLEVGLVAYFRGLTTQILATVSDVIARHDDDGDEYANTFPDDEDTPYHDDEDLTHQSGPEPEPSAPLLRGEDRNAPSDSPENTDPVVITTADMTTMGLDIWSPADRVFVEELAKTWWGREARVDTARFRCCGVAVL